MVFQSVCICEDHTNHGHDRSDSVCCDIPTVGMVASNIISLVFVG